MTPCRCWLTASAAASLLAIGVPAKADVFTNVPAGELAGYQLAYDWNIPDSSGGWNTVAVPYTTNNAASFATGSFDRVAYYLELDSTWVYASFSATGFLTDATKLGVPSRGPNGSAIVSNMAVSSMNVFSNVGGITTGTGLTGGKVEFWASNYGAGANGVFDHDDNGFDATAGHGSMQIHNTTAPQTLFGYSAWGTIRDSELGIGNGPNTGGNAAGPEPDWTFNTGNNDLFTTQRMQIFVHVPEPGSLSAIAAAGALALHRRRRKQSA